LFIADNTAPTMQDSSELPHSYPDDRAVIEPVPAVVAPALEDTPPDRLGFTFTGSGKEYFRIWIVNLFLTVATLGIYSAWAKVRRLQYFDRNTEVGGAVFDFRGDPKAILRGRLLAVVMLVAYHYAFGFSLTVGVAVLSVLLLSLPFLLRSALRFRLHNTAYRGLHFDFTGSIAGAYLAYLPPIMTVLLPSALLAVDPSGMSTAAASLLYLGWPLMHGAMKGYQHRHLKFGGARSAYALSAWRFYKPYLVAGASLIGMMVVFGIVVAIAVKLAEKNAMREGGFAVWLPMIGSLIGIYVAYLLIGPYIQVRVANLALSNTRFPGIQMRSAMSARAFARLQTGNVFLTLLTLGLYRPFAVVKIHRFRLAHLTLHTDAGFEQLLAAAARSRGGATGDGAADFFGFDLSW
jgi:uncharacterized membrane protein YjgN (DUF898 family)